MNRKALVYIGVFIGGTIGGYIPVLFGADAFSIWSLFTSALGSIAGIWAAFKVSQMM